MQIFFVSVSINSLLYFMQCIDFDNIKRDLYLYVWFCGTAQIILSLISLDPCISITARQRGDKMSNVLWKCWNKPAIVGDCLQYLQTSSKQEWLCVIHFTRHSRFGCFNCWRVPDGPNFIFCEVNNIFWLSNTDSRCSKQKNRKF